jgi:uracil-DNA glycosylase
MVEFDPGPPPEVAEHFARVPSSAPHRELSWYDWRPVFYRGRLDGSARVLCIASDPGPTERVAGRTLVGHAGQRVQGFLHKLGLTRSYACLNACVRTAAITLDDRDSDPVRARAAVVAK